MVKTQVNVAKIQVNVAKIQVNVAKTQVNVAKIQVWFEICLTKINSISKLRIILLTKIILKKKNI